MKPLFTSATILVVAIASFCYGRLYERNVAWDEAWSEGFQSAHRQVAYRCEPVDEVTLGSGPGVIVNCLRGDGKTQRVFIANSLSDKDELVVSHRMDDNGSEWGAWWWLPLGTLKRDEVTIK